MQDRHAVSKPVYDPLLRLLHAWIALAITGLVATAWLAGLFEHGASEAAVWRAHSLIGYALILGLAARILWGFIGPRHARWRDFLHPVAWRAFLDSFRRLDGTGSGGSGMTWATWHRRLRWPRRDGFGHDPMASLAFLAVYAILVIQSALGLALVAIEQGSGPLAGILGDATAWKEFFKEPHETLYSAILAFVVVHLAMLVWHQMNGQRVAQAMITGIQTRPVEDRP
jgi:cytochrome b